MKGNKDKEAWRATKEWKAFSKRLRAERQYCECCKTPSKRLAVHHMDDSLDTILSTLSTFLPNLAICPVYKMDTLQHLVKGQISNTLETPAKAYQINFDEHFAVALQSQLDSRKVMEVPGL